MCLPSKNLKISERDRQTDRQTDREGEDRIGRERDKESERGRRRERERGKDGERKRGEVRKDTNIMNNDSTYKDLAYCLVLAGLDGLSRPACLKCTREP